MMWRGEESRLTKATKFLREIVLIPKVKVLVNSLKNKFNFEQEYFQLLSQLKMFLEPMQYI